MNRRWNGLVEQEDKPNWTAPLSTFGSHRRQTVDATGGVFHRLAAVVKKTLRSKIAQSAK